jgi:predicted nucleotidyltransferase
MDRVVTLAERKAAAIARKREGLVRLRAMLVAYARAHGGRFLLFGSAARDELRVHSDADILVDFPRPGIDDAWVFAEEACRACGLSPDIRPRGWCSPSFLQHIEPEVEVLG